MNTKISNYLSQLKDWHFVVFWTILNLVQNYAMDLTSDEGYYWFYSQHLDWGFYDHPPLVAVLIKLGTLFFGGEFGVRAVNTLLMSVGVFFFLKTIASEKKWIVYLLLLSMPMLSYITFIVFPDTSLIALSAIALYLYKQFLENENLKTSLLLGVLLALMFYAKYHAILFVFFIVLSNFSLLKNKYFYLILGVSLVLFMPHLWWQYQHDFPTFVYHLKGRSSAFRIDFLVDYTLQQLIFVGLGLVFVPFVYKSKNKFEKSLIFICIGVLLFFLLSSFRGFVHFHWTSICIFPIIYLAHQFYEDKKSKLIFWSLCPMIVLLFVARLQLGVMILPFNNLHVDYFHQRQLWAEDIKKIAQNRTVVFESGGEGLREASLYQFYSNQFSVALFPEEGKKSQYQILNYEDSIQGKAVLLIKFDTHDDYQDFKTRMGKTIHYKEIDTFSSFNNLLIECQKDKIIKIGKKISVPITLYNHRKETIYFKKEERFFIDLKDQSDLDKYILASAEIDIPNGLNANSSYQTTLDFELEYDLKGDYTFCIGIDDHTTNLTFNSKRAKISF